MATKTLRVFAEYTSTGFVPMPTAGNIDYGYTLGSTFPATTPTSFQTDNPDLVVTVTAMTDFYVWIRVNGTAWNPSYTRNVRVYPDSPNINNVVMNMIIATGPAGVSSYTQIVQTSNRLYFNGATTDSIYNSKFAGKTYINELNFGTAPGLATVATSGAYADLTGKPSLATVATSGLFTDLSSKPSGTAPLSYNSGTNSFVITQANTSTNGFLSSTDWNTFNNKFSTPAGTTLQYVDGTGALQTFPLLASADKLVINVRNASGVSMPKGSVVYINGATGNKPTVALAQGNSDAASAQTLGLLQTTLANNAEGNVVIVGAVTDLNTSAFAEGQQLYLSPTTAGAYTATKQYAPNHLVYVGIVSRSHVSLGTIEVKVQNGYEMDELHNVSAQSPSNNDGLFYNTTTSLWEKKSIATVLGYTPYNGTNTSIKALFSASAPLSYSDGVYSISQASASSNGYLSSTDWNTFNNKGSGNGTVTSVAMSVPTGLSISGTPITTSGTLALSLTAGYVIPTTSSASNWDSAYTNRITSLTVTGSSGSATLVSNVLNIPTYTLVGLGGQTALNGTGFVKISGTTISYDNSTYLTTASASSTYQTIITNNITGTGTINELAYFNTSSSIASLGVATYPSLTELAYVKGVTSSIQTQLNAKASTLSGTTGYHAKFTSSSAIGNSLIYDNGTNVGIGTTSATRLLTIQGGTSNSGLQVLSTNGYRLGLIAGVGSSGAGLDQGYFEMTNQGIAKIALNTAGVSYINGGNLGVGVVPQTWYSTVSAIQFSSGGALWGIGFSNNIFSANEYLDAAGTSKYIGADAASRYQQNAGNHVWSTAGSGTAGSNISFSERMRITAEGNLGFGMTPYNNGLSKAIDLVGGGGMFGFNNGFYLSGNGYFTDAWRYKATGGLSIIELSSAGNIVFSNVGSGSANASASPTEKMRITSGGNVGIGTTSPLDTYTGRTVLTINNNGAFGAFLNFGYNGSLYGFICQNTDILQIGTQANIPMSFGTNANERMRITSAGNVGIGTSSPNGKLEVAGRITSIATANNGIGAGPNFYLEGGGSSYTILQQSVSKFEILTYDGASWGYRMAIFSGGNVAIGTSSDNGYKLYVSGTIYATGNITANSDLTLKKNLKLIDNPIDKLMQLNGYAYQWKANDEHQYGVIAQEVEKVLPYAVQTGNDKIKGVAYNQIIPVLIEAIKTQQAEINTLKSKLA